MEDRSDLFNEIQKFSFRKLNKVQTKLVTPTGETVIEKKTAKGLQSVSGGTTVENDKATGDLQVGLIIPGLMIGSQDVAKSHKVLTEYEISHIVNLACNEVTNDFEDEFNYLSLNILDTPDTSLKKYMDEIFDFIEEGKHRGNVFIHCDARKPGLSRSTAFSVAYLMCKEKKRFNDAYNEVKEARPFVKPNDGFITQLKAYDEELFNAKKSDDIEDPFTKKKRLEIEAEKAMLKGTTTVKNKLQMFKQAEDTDQNRVSSPTPGKIRVNWGQDQESGENQTGDEKPQPKKLTSILSIFQSKDANIVRPVASKPITNTGPVKKWKPVETKGLQRTKQIEVNKEKPEVFSFYDRVKKSKSGTKWAQRGALKKTKSKDLSSKVLSRQKSTEVKDEPKPPPETKPSIKSETKTSPKTQTETRPTTKSGPPPPPPPSGFFDDKKPKTIKVPPPPPSGPLDDKKSKTGSVVPPPPSGLLDKKPKPALAAPKPEPPKAKAEPKTPTIVKSEPVKPAEASKENKKPEIRRRPSKEEPEEPAAPQDDNAYPWRKRRRSSDLGQRRRSSSGLNDQETAPTSTPPQAAPVNQKPVSPTPPAKQSAPKTIPPTAIPSTETAQNSTTGTLPGDVAQRKVFGLTKPPQKNIKGSNIFNAYEKPELKHEAPKPEPPKAVSPIPKQATEPVAKTVAPPPADVRPTGSFFKVGRPRVEINADPVKIIQPQPVEESEEESEEDDESDEEEKEEQPVRPKGLTRSSTAEILKLIKSKTKSELAPPSMDAIDEDDEIDVLLDGLEKEGIENIDWGELGIGLDQVKDIVENAESESESETDSDDDEEDDEEEEEEEEDEEEKEIANLLKNLEKEGEFDEKAFNLSGKSTPISGISITSKVNRTPSPRLPGRGQTQESE